MDAEEAAVALPLLLGSEKELQACKYRINTERKQHQEAIQVHSDQCEIIGIYFDGTDGEWRGGLNADRTVSIVANSHVGWGRCL